MKRGVTMKGRSYKILDTLINKPQELSLLERYELKHNVVTSKTDCFNDDEFRMLLYDNTEYLSYLLALPLIMINNKISNNHFTKNEKNRILNFLRTRKG